MLGLHQCSFKGSLSSFRQDFFKVRRIVLGLAGFNFHLKEPLNNQSHEKDKFDWRSIKFYNVL